MNAKQIRKLILILSSLAALSVLLLCVFAMLRRPGIEIMITFGSCMLRTLVLFAFLVFYYSSVFSGMGMDSVFLPLFLLSTIVSELRIIPTFAAVTCIYPGNPLFITRLIVFSYMLSGLSIFGFGFFYQQRERKMVTLFILLVIATSLIIALVLPVSQDVALLGSNIAFSCIVAIIYACAALLFLRHIIVDPPGTYLIRHFGALLFLAGNIVNAYYTTQLAGLVGTGFMVLSYLTILVASKVSDVRY